MEQTLDDILSYSSKFDWETMGVVVFDDISTFVITLLLVGFGLLCATLGVLGLFDAEDGLPVIILVVGLAVLMVVGMFHYSKYDSLTQESRSLYEVEEAKWEREMATLYMTNLPVVRHQDIERIEYSYELEVENEKMNQKANENMTPVKVTLENGKAFKMWAKVIPLKEEMDSSQLEFKHLEKDLIFHERSEIFKEKGYLDVVLYTDEKL